MDSVRYELLFTGGTATIDGLPVRFAPHRLGTLPLTSGVVVCFDPFDENDDEPPTFEVTAPQAELVLSLAELPDGDRRVAAACLHLAPEPPAKWEDADFYLDVSSSLAAFADLQTMARLTALEEAAHDQVLDQLRAQLHEHRTDTWTWAELAVPDAGPLLAFSSGMGEGDYDLFVGKTGKAISAIWLDLGLLP